MPDESENVSPSRAMHFLRTEPWIEQESAGCTFADVRLGKRFQRVLEQMGGMGRPLPLACGDWAATKAAYRFLDNVRVGEAEILVGLSQTTQAHFAAADGPLLVLHDTTEFLATGRRTAIQLGYALAHDFV